MDECERLEEVEQIVDELKDRALCGAVVLVEGPRDRDALRRLGISGEIVMTSQRQLFPLAESLARSGKDIVVLTDWDERGDEVAKQVSMYLEADGARPDNEIRGSLKSLVRKEIKDVESLHGYVEKLRKICSAKPQHY
jgi:5S rRNA maturation endonuclease (ribonuclease M5)